MAIISFIEPPQMEMTDTILQHCGLSRLPEARPPPDADGLAHELDYVDMESFLATFRELQRVGSELGLRRVPSET